MQYVGEDKYKKVFVDITCTHQEDKSKLTGKVYNGEPLYELIPLKESFLRPIDPSNYKSILESTGRSRRYEVRDYGGFFEMDENHRDSYPCHLPGFLKIQELKIGEIIPVSGFTTDCCLSDIDKLLLSITSVQKKDEAIRELKRVFRNDNKAKNN